MPIATHHSPRRERNFPSLPSPTPQKKDGGRVAVIAVAAAGRSITTRFVLGRELGSGRITCVRLTGRGCHAGQLTFPALLSIAAVPSWDAPPFSVHILPVGRIDARAAEVNGYTPALWEERGAMTPKNALLQFQHWLFQVRSGRPFEKGRFDMAAHNAGFDLLFMAAIQQRTGIDLELPGIWHCTKILMQEHRENGHGYWPKSCKLDDLGLVTGFWKKEPRSTAHDALKDARCCAHGLQWLRNLSEKKEGRADG